MMCQRSTSWRQWVATQGWVPVFAAIACVCLLLPVWVVAFNWLCALSGPGPSPEWMGLPMAALGALLLLQGVAGRSVAYVVAASVAGVAALVVAGHAVAAAWLFSTVFLLGAGTKVAKLAFGLAARLQVRFCGTKQQQPQNFDGAK